MTPSIPITWQIVVNTHDGSFHLFELDTALPGTPQARMLLADVPGVPNVAGPDAGFDNIIKRVLFNGKTQRFMCQLQGFREGGKNLEEVKKEDLPDWVYVAQLGNVHETGPRDLLDGG